jgi:hypothetical protein
VRYNQRVRAERAWLAQAIEWAREHPDSSAAQVAAAIPNPDRLLIRPLAGAAVAAAARDREGNDCGWEAVTVRGAGTSTLPEWARNLVHSCHRYTFTTQQVYNGRSVVATRIDDGPGPLLVITSSEQEMRIALGLRSRKLRP